MAKAQIYLCLIIFLYLSWEKTFLRVNGEAVSCSTCGQSQGDWCVANPVTGDDKLLKNINYACSKIDCRIILEGGACYCPNNPLNHASVAMNLYYQAQGRNRLSCNFEGSGLVTVVDPSFGNCKFQYRK